MQSEPPLHPNKLDDSMKSAWHGPYSICAGRSPQLVGLVGQTPLYAPPRKSLFCHMFLQIAHPLKLP